MSEFNTPTPEHSKQHNLEAFQAVREVDPAVYDIAELAAKVEPFHGATQNVASILDDKGHRMCDVQASGELFVRGDPKKSASVELRSYHGGEPEHSVYLFADNLEVPLKDRTVTGMAACEVMADGRKGVKLVHKQAGEFELSPEDETMVRLSMLKHFNAALLSMD